MKLKFACSKTIDFIFGHNMKIIGQYFIYYILSMSVLQNYLVVWRPILPLHPGEPHLPCLGLMERRHGQQIHPLHQRDIHLHGDHARNLFGDLPLLVLGPIRNSLTCSQKSCTQKHEHILSSVTLKVLKSSHNLMELKQCWIGPHSECIVHKGANHFTGQFRR